MSTHFNILMYSHDTFGLGHIRRTMAIASHLLDEGVNILILTGSPLVGRFDFPQGIDFVRVPGMIKKTNKVYLPSSIRVETKVAMKIRREIITATAKSFKPGMFIVDKAPQGLKREILPALKWFKKNSPHTRVILGLRDIMDDAESTRQDWRKKGVYQVLRELYNEIWVYGDQEIYDPVTEYELPPDIAAKLYFTGYIPRQVPKPERLEEVRQELGLSPDEKVVLVTTGGGGDGYKMLHNYLKMVHKYGPMPFRTIMVSGPFLPKDKREEFQENCAELGVQCFGFYKGIERVMATADLVVCMGGYNTVCEVLSQGKVALVIPRHYPRLEQMIRAQVMSDRGLLDYLPWQDLSARNLRDKVLQLLDHPEPIQQAVSEFTMNGLSAIRSRLAHFRERS